MAYSDKLDVWSIQYDGNEINTALDGWVNEGIEDGETILFSNTECSFKLGDNLIRSKQWDRFIYSPTNDKLIMIMRDGALSNEELMKSLETRNINYHEVTFRELEPEYEDDNSYMEFWTARDAETLDEFLEDSVTNENSFNGVYYPLLKGSVVLGYRTNKGKKEVPVEGRVIEGLIVMEDKAILLLKVGDKAIDPSEIMNLLKLKGINYTVDPGENIDMSSIKKRSKT